MHKLSVIILTILFLTSCDSKQVLDEYQTIPNSWEKDSAINFQFESPDTTNRYNLFINIRNNNDYPFSNLYLITEFEDPQENKITDTLEYEMAKPDGTWLGTGSSIKENKLWFKEKIRFKNIGTHNISVKHAMRKNGNELGVEHLEGITDVGFRIEKTDNNK